MRARGQSFRIRRIRFRSTDGRRKPALTRRPNAGEKCGSGCPGQKVRGQQGRGMAGSGRQEGALKPGLENSGEPKTACNGAKYTLRGRVSPVRLFAEYDAASLSCRSSSATDVSSNARGCKTATLLLINPLEQAPAGSHPFAGHTLINT